MATYYVWSGATGGTNAGTSWTNAYLLFSSAVTAATASGDIILVHYTHQDQTGADTTYSFGNHVIVVSVNKDSSDAPTAMGTGGWIGHDNSARSIILTGAFKVYFSGMTFRTSTSTADNLRVDCSDGSNFEFENCYFWQGNTGASTGIRIGGTQNAYIRFINTTFRFGTSSQNFAFRAGRIEFEGCNISSAGSAPTTLIDDIFAASGETDSGPDIKFISCDLSHVTGTLVGSMNNQSRGFIFSQCKFGVNVTVMATQTPANKSSAFVWAFDCSSGDTHGLFGYYDAFGSCVSDTGVYFTSGAAAQSWKITTTANCSLYTPFVSPFVDFYNTGTNSITPYFEILRDGSTTAFQNDEVWGEFFVKTTSGSTQSTESSDRMTLLGTPANQAAGAGTGSWTGEAASAWSGKIDSGSAVTPAESGHIRGRVVVGEPSITVYADPQIRT